jgi:hypothetical protein
MDDANVSGTTITDVVGGLNGTAGSSVSSTAGPYTTARAIGNDVNGSITLASNPIENLAAAFSIGFWVFRTPWNTAAYDGNGPRILRINDSSIAFDAANDPSLPGRIEFGNGNVPSVRDCQLNSGIAAATWTHITYTFDASTALIYVNGAVSSSTNAMTGGSGFQNTLGAAKSGSSNAPIGGNLYQVVMYTQALSSTDVMSLFNAEAVSLVQQPKRGICLSNFGYR